MGDFSEKQEGDDMNFLHELENFSQDQEHQKTQLKLKPSIVEYEINQMEIYNRKPQSEPQKPVVPPKEETKQTTVQNPGPVNRLGLLDRIGKYLPEEERVPLMVSYSVIGLLVLMILCAWKWG